MIRTSRERFLEDKAQAASHAELCVNASFIRAVDAAMLEYVREMPSANDAHSSMANSWKIQGAREVLTKLMTLADPAPPRVKRPLDNLPDSIRP